MDISACTRIDRHQFFGSKMVVELIANELDREPTCGIEIGVYNGVTSMMLLRYFRHLHLWMIDPYREYEDVERTSGQHELAKETATLRTDCFSGRRQQIFADSLAAKHLFPTAFADFIFIDGDHSYTGVTNDLQNYTPRVRKGGMIIVHDIKQGQVFRAVKDYCRTIGLPFFSGRAKSGWFFPDDGHDIEANFTGMDRSVVKVCKTRRDTL